MKIAIIGAGSTYTPELIEGILLHAASLEVSELALMDIDTRKLDIVGGLALRMIERSGLRCEAYLTQELDRALTGADFVLCQLRVGKLPARILDETIPLRHGLLGQETTGIGGFFKGQRTIPVMMHIARRMEALCPDAFLINFSNPAGMVTQALLAHTPIRAVGLCNVPFNMQRSIQAQLGLAQPEFTSVGLNHLSWIISVREKGHEYIDEAIARGIAAESMKNIPDGLFDADLLHAVRAIPSPYLSYFYQRESKLEHAMHAEKCRGQLCTEIEEELLTLYADPMLAEKPEQLARRGGANYSTVAISLVDAIYNDKREVHVVNVQNRGALSYMRDGDVVETEAIVGKTGAIAKPAPDFRNPHIEALMQACKAYELLAVEAALSGNRDTALAALLVHPLVGDFPAAKACFEEMLEAHRDYLPQYH